jgi:hypothetical protein
MSSSRPRPRWWFLITPRWLAWHAFAVVAAWGMLWLGDWQFHRAVGGNALSWAYTFEWPVFTIFGVVFWTKTIVDEFKTRGAQASDGMKTGADLALPATAHVAASADDADDEDDPELAAYNAYLSGLASGRRTGRFQGGSGRVVT